MLVSPGQEITIIDDSQYVSSSVGTVPFILLATAQDKTFQGLPAAYTSKANAGQLLSFSSQRDMITNLGYPLFKQSSAGTPLNAYETNEYGLMAGYSAMGVSNKSFVIRADIDLAQLEGTAVRPIGLPLNGTMWLDTADSTWGIYEWNATTQSYVNRIPLVITDPTEVSGTPPLPLPSIGSIDSYAVIALSATATTSAYNNICYKGSDNQWTHVGNPAAPESPSWQNEWPAVTGNVAAVGGNFTGLTTQTLVLNNVIITAISTSLTNTVQQINTAGITGVSAAAVNNQLALYATSVATNGEVTIAANSTALSTLGLTSGTYAAPAIQYGSYVSVPDWRSTDATPRPTGSVWFKTSTLGSGTNFVLKEFNANNDAWTSIATPIYADDADAIYNLDPTAGGSNIQAGTVYVQQDALFGGSTTVGTGSFLFLDRTTQGALTITGSNTSPTFNNTVDNITVSVTQVGVAGWLTATANISGNTAQAFVSTISSLNLPYLVATVTGTGAISLSHAAGGSIKLSQTGLSDTLAKAGFIGATGVTLIPGTSAPQYLASNFTKLLYTAQSLTPYTAPADGTLWFFNSPLDVDIMVNDLGGWKGYKNVTLDARGYNLSNTDPLGPIMSPTAPITQTDNTPLVPGDLWVNTGELTNAPVISRYTGTSWSLINNADSVDQNGIVFADARWDTTGTTDPVAGNYPSIVALQSSNYLDIDAPDYRLYPRGTLLFNLRRSGYNVKHFVADYFNTTAFSVAGWTATTAYTAGTKVVYEGVIYVAVTSSTNQTPLANPTYWATLESATWVTSSGLQNNGAPYMGAGAQRAMVVKALKAAIDGSDTLREESFQFNLITCPGYPELIPDMVNLNNDRKNTAFVIGDTPMHLAANGKDVTNWSTDANGDGLATADPYMGVYYPSGLTTDLSGNNIVVPPSHMVLRAAIKSDNVSYPWFAFAGTRRGLVDNCSDIGYVDANLGEFVRNGINQGMRDTLYPLAINPITLLSGVGLTIFGNKTRVGVASSLDRVNVARLVNYIRTILASVGNAYLFEPDDKTTWDSIAQVISSAMNDLVTKRAIYDYAVVCDSSNNTPQRIANNELYVDIAIEPEKDVEFIYIPIRLMNPGAIASGGK